MKVDLNNKIAVVTGAARGLGRKTAMLLAENGASVWAFDSSHSALETFALEMDTAGYQTACRSVDVSSQAAVQEAFAAAIGSSGRVDILVNCAGIPYTGTFADLDQQALQRIIDVNIKGVIHCMKYAMEHMMERGTGKIVNLSSIAGRSGKPRQPFYSMSKSAVINLTQSAALTAAGRGVNVNCVCPGIIYTAMWEKLLNDFSGKDHADREAFWKAYVKERIPMGRAQEDIDIANAVLFLCSDEARYITGQSLNVCGGAELN